jgi:hypothetical protein
MSDGKGSKYLLTASTATLAVNELPACLDAHREQDFMAGGDRWTGSQKLIINSPAQGTFCMNRWDGPSRCSERPRLSEYSSFLLRTTKRCRLAMLIGERLPLRVRKLLGRCR